MTVEHAEELLARPSGDFELGVDPAPGVRSSPRTAATGPTFTEILPEDTPKTGKNAIKPRTASLFKSMALDTVTLEEALKLMSLPRVVGKDADGVEITAQNGRYGPYLKKGTDSRRWRPRTSSSASPSTRPWRSTPSPRPVAAPPPSPRSRSSAPDPVSQQPVVVKDGRFGPYVTDGETNATLRREDDVETITPERGYELLAEKRAKGP